MTGLRFTLGATVMCNMGPGGWKLGRIIALNYREDHWPADRIAPYQVVLEADRALIYVPEDDDSYCREPTAEDLRIARRGDALAALPGGVSESVRRGEGDASVAGTLLGCAGDVRPAGDPGYRDGRCEGCHCCPPSWSAVELYSEHYRCAARTGLPVARRSVDLGTVRVGEALALDARADLPVATGFDQCPTRARLPPGLEWSDDGVLSGHVRFDPHQSASYRVEFVAVSTAAWEDPDVGLVRVEVRFTVEGNEVPEGFDVRAFTRRQQDARDAASGHVRHLIDTWTRWERGQQSIPDTCAQMVGTLGRLRALLEEHPRLDGGRWWGQLGGFHMNVHKLLENALFECELYLGHALTFGDPEVRSLAEQNLEGCYQKRLLEAARFVWMDGLELMMQGAWARAAETLRLAAAKKDGWGWAVNNGDIWLSESAARLIHGATLATRPDAEKDEAARQIAEAKRLLRKAVARADQGGYLGPEGHPWASEIDAALSTYLELRERSAETSEWLASFELRTAYWCAQALAGAFPFPPPVRPRREDAGELVQRLRERGA